MKGPNTVEAAAPGRECERMPSGQLGDVPKVGQPVRPATWREALQDGLGVDAGERTRRDREQLTNIARNVHRTAVCAVVQGTNAEVISRREERARAFIPDREREVADEALRTILSPTEIRVPRDVGIGRLARGHGDFELAT